MIQFIRYGLVVVIAAPVDLGGYVLFLYHWHMQVVLAATLSFTISLIVNYFLSMAWVWNHHSGKQKRLDIIWFAIIGFVGLGITDLIIWALVNGVSTNKVVAKLVAFVIVFFWSFGARRYLFHGQLFDSGQTNK